MSLWKAVWILLLCGALLSDARSVSAQGRKEEKPAADRPGDQTEDKELSEQALELARSESRTYSFSLGQERGAELKFNAEPVLRWSNPQQGTIYGGVFVWTLDGRPEVVGSIYKWFAPHTHLSAEFQSLSLESVKAARDGQDVWTPSRPGVAFQPVPGAAAPAATAAARLRQLRELAKEFTAVKTDRDGTKQNLRLLTQPIFRYESPRRGVQDGALFSFVEGTDPETFLLLEARQADAGPQWQVAATRMNSTAFEVSHKDKKIWGVEILPWRDVSGHKEPYTSFQRKQVD